MATKYAFTKSLKEVRFLFCQTSEHSAATRYVESGNPLTPAIVLCSSSSFFFSRRADRSNSPLPRIKKELPLEFQKTRRQRTTGDGWRCGRKSTTTNNARSSSKTNRTVCKHPNIGPSSPNRTPP